MTFVMREMKMVMREMMMVLMIIGFLRAAELDLGGMKSRVIMIYDILY